MPLCAAALLATSLTSGVVWGRSRLYVTSSGDLMSKSIRGFAGLAFCFPIVREDKHWTLWKRLADLPAKDDIAATND